MNGQARRGTGRAKAFLGLLGLIGLCAVLLPLLLPAPGQVCIRLSDPVLHSEVGAWPIELRIDGGLTKYRTQKTPEGLEIYVERVSEGQRGIQVNAQGYAPASVEVAVRPLELVRADLPLTPVFGLLEYRTVDAKTDGEIAANVAISGASGTPAKAGAKGRVLLEPGDYAIKADAAGFCPSSSRVRVESGKSTPVNVALSPDLTENELARIVLVWKQDPRDIDAIMLQNVAGRKVFTFWKNKQTSAAGKPVSTLDIDHIRGLGPETVTVFKGHGGVTSFLVRFYEGSGTLGSSGAVVRIITKGCTEQVFEVPPGTTARVWHVADIKEDAQGQAHVSVVNASKSDADIGFGVPR